MIAFVYTILLIIFLIGIRLHYQPKKHILEKYGKPSYHFTTCMAIYSLPFSKGGPHIDLDVFDEFIVVSICKRFSKPQEIIIDKNFKDYEIYGSVFCSIWEIKSKDINIQICLGLKSRKTIEDFFKL